MNDASRRRWLACIGAAALVAAFGGAAATIAPAPAAARVFVGVGVGFPGYYAPAPYYDGYPGPYYPPPPPTYYAPPPAYYAPPAAAPAAAPSITYTNRPPFYNRAGEQCRQFETTGMGGGQATHYGTACEGADGQWRIAD